MQVVVPPVVGENLGCCRDTMLCMFLPFNCVVLHSEGEKPKGHCGPSLQIIALVIAYPELSTSGIQAQSL